MKTRLLTLAALGWAASAMAGSWEAPTVGAGAKVDPTDGAIVYVYNEAKAQFLTGANAWGTQASLTTAGLAFQLVSEPLQQAEAYPEISAWGMKNQRADKMNQYVFYDGGGDSFIDMGNQNGANPDCHHWNFTKQADGTYTIQLVEQCPLFNSETPCYFAWAGAEDGVVKPGFDISAAEGEYGMYWSFVSEEGYAAYNAKFELYNKLNEAEAEGVSTADAEAVYNSATATAEEIAAAATALDGAIVAKKTEEAFKGASVDNPADATFLIKNADFSENTSASDQPGWDCTFNAWQQSRVDGPSGGVQIVGPFVEQWVSGGNKLADYYCKQKITLPAGLYSLSANITARQQGDSNAEVTGCNFFAAVQGEDTLSVGCSSQAVGDNPVKYTIQFYIANDGTPVYIGFETVSTTANWVAFDNFELQYLGNEGGEDFINMKVSQNVVNGLVGDYDPSYGPTDKDGYFDMSEATYEAALALVEESARLTAASSSEELKDMKAKLDDMTTKVNEEKAAYAELKDLFVTVQDAADLMGEIQTVGEMMGTLCDKVQEHLEAGDIDVAGIKALQAEYDNIIKVEFPKVIEPGMDLTALLVNPNFTKNITEGWTWANGSGNFGASACEAYETNFNVYQELTGLPNGLYEVGLQGFCRQGWANVAAANYEAGTEDIQAYVYGMSGGMTKKTPFKSVFDGRDSESHYTEGVTDVSHLINPWGPTDSEITINGETCYVPNGMAGFAIWEEMGDNRYQATAQVFVADGTLRIGAACDDWRDGGFWTIFDSFTLKYVSDQMGDIVKEAAREELQRIQSKYDNLAMNQPLPADLSAALTALSEELEAAEGDEAVKAVSAKMPDVEKNITDVAAEAAAQRDIYNYFNNRVFEVESSDPDNYAAWLTDELYDHYIEGETWESTEAMRAELAKMKEGWTKYATADKDSNPDVSAAILNNGFEVDNTNSNKMWDIEMTEGANAANYSEQEFYNNEKFNMSQTITGLAAGYYELEVQGFYRPGWPATALPADTTFTNFAELYATIGETIWATPMQTIYTNTPTEEVVGGAISAKLAVEGADSATIYFPNSMEVAHNYFVYCSEDEEPSENPNAKGYYRGNKVIFQVAEGQAVTLGVKKDNHTAGDWCIFDDFQLIYKGTTAPEDYQEGVPTVVAKPAASVATKQEYYTIGGLKLDRPTQGVNIVVTTLSDGTVIKSKVVIK